MHKTEIGWARLDDLGGKVDVFARRVGREWQFFARSRRYEQWQRLREPPIEDWLELLDAVKRRVGRQLLRPEEIRHVVGLIRRSHPEADL